MCISPLPPLSSSGQTKSEQIQVVFCNMVFAGPGWSTSSNQLDQDGLLGQPLSHQLLV